MKLFFVFLMLTAVFLISGCSGKEIESSESNIVDVDYRAQITISSQEGAKFTFKALNTGTETVSSYKWWVDGVLQISTDDTISFTFTSDGGHTVEVKFYDSNNSEVEYASLSVDIPEDEIVTGSFLDNEYSTVIGEINDTVNGIKIPFMIKDQNENVIFEGETDEEGDFEAHLITGVPSGGFYEPKLYAKDYDIITGAFSDTYTLIDDDFMCDVDDPYLNPYPRCLGLVVGSYTWTYDANEFRLKGLCSMSVDYLNIDAPMGNIKTFSINFSVRNGSCGSDSEDPIIESAFWFLDTYRGYRDVTVSGQAVSVNFESNFIRLSNMGFTYNDMEIHSVTVEYNNY